MVGGQLNGYGSHAFYSAAYPDQYEATRTLVFSGQWSVALVGFGLWPPASRPLRALPRGLCGLSAVVVHGPQL